MYKYKILFCNTMLSYYEFLKNVTGLVHLDKKFM